MRLRVRMIATMAGAVLLAQSFLLLAAVDTDSPAPPKPYSRGLRMKPEKADLFFGYTYFRGVPTLSPGNRMVDLNGGSASIAFNLNRYLGLVGDFGGYSDTQLRTVTGTASPVVVNSSGTAFTYLFGPRLSYRGHDRITPFAQVLFGGVHASPVTISGCTGTLCTPLPGQDSFALTAGGGLDVKLNHRFALRVVQAEYLMTRFADPASGASDSRNDLRLSAGLVVRFGEHMASPPLAYTCTADPGSVFAGEPISVTGTAMNLNPSRVVTYTWATDGGKITGTSATAAIDTSGSAPGTYTASGHLNARGKPGLSADCSAAYTVKAPQPPTVSCTSEPGTVRPGEAAAVSAQGTSPANRPLTYSYSASQGAIVGTTSSATLNTGQADSGTIIVTCNVADDKGQSASSTTTVAIQAPMPAPATMPMPMTQKLCSIDFGRDAERPTRVNNEGKACLDEVALTLQRSPDATIAFVGNQQAGEQGGSRKRSDAAQRSVNAKAYLVAEKGIDGSRVTLYTGSGQSYTVATTLIPSGATFDPTGLSPVEEPSLTRKPGPGRKTR